MAEFICDVCQLPTPEASRSALPGRCNPCWQELCKQYAAVEPAPEEPLSYAEQVRRNSAPTDAPPKAMSCSPPYISRHPGELAPGERHRIVSFKREVSSKAKA